MMDDTFTLDDEAEELLKKLLQADKERLLVSNDMIYSTDKSMEEIDKEYETKNKYFWKVFSRLALHLKLSLGDKTTYPKILGTDDGFRLYTWYIKRLDQFSEKEFNSVICSACPFSGNQDDFKKNFIPYCDLLKKKFIPIKEHECHLVSTGQISYDNLHFFIKNKGEALYLNIMQADHVVWPDFLKKHYPNSKNLSEKEHNEVIRIIAEKIASDELEILLAKKEELRPK